MGKAAEMGYDSKTRVWKCRGRCSKGAAVVLRRSGVGAQKVAGGSEGRYSKGPASVLKRSPAVQKKKKKKNHVGKRLKTGGSAKALAAEIKGRGLVRHDNAFSSRHKGVYWDKKLQKWRAAVQHGGKKEYLGVFAIEEEAKACRDARCLELGVDPAAGVSSGFRGVRWCKHNLKWKADIELDGKVKSLGCFEATARGEVAAALAFDAAAWAAGRPESANFELQAFWCDDSENEFNIQGYFTY